MCTFNNMIRMRNVAITSWTVAMVMMCSGAFVLPSLQKGHSWKYQTLLAVLPDFYPLPCERINVQPMCVDHPKYLDTNKTCDIITCLSFTNRAMADGKEVKVVRPITVFGWKCRNANHCTDELCDNHDSCLRKKGGKWCPRRYCMDKYCTKEKKAVLIDDGRQTVTDVTVEYPCGCQCTEV